MGEGLNDNQIFTFIVLLASVLIDNSMGVPTRYDLNGLEYPSPSTSDSRDGEISGGERKSINEAYFYVYLKACISEIQERYFNGFNAYSKRKFHIDVNFTLKRFLKSTWKTCVNGFGCAKCSYIKLKDNFHPSIIHSVSRFGCLGWALRAGHQYSWSDS